MKNFRIEEIGDINTEYPYLEVFFKKDSIPFLEISISVKKELFFKLYPTKADILLTVEEWEYILETAKEFLPRVLKNEDDYLTFIQE